MTILTYQLCMMICHVLNILPPAFSIFAGLPRQQIEGWFINNLVSHHIWVGYFVPERGVEASAAQRALLVRVIATAHQ